MLYRHNAAIGTDWNLFFGIKHCSQKKYGKLYNENWEKLKNI